MLDRRAAAVKAKDSPAWRLHAGVDWEDMPICTAGLRAFAYADMGVDSRWVELNVEQRRLLAVLGFTSECWDAAAAAAPSKQLHYDRSTPRKKKKKSKKNKNKKKKSKAAKKSVEFEGSGEVLSVIEDQPSNAPVLSDEQKPPKKIPFFRFAHENRAEVMLQHPEASFSECAEIIGKLWRELTDEQRRRYKDTSTAVDGDGADGDAASIGEGEATMDSGFPDQFVEDLLCDTVDEGPSIDDFRWLCQSLELMQKLSLFVQRWIEEGYRTDQTDTGAVCRVGLMPAQLRDYQKDGVRWLRRAWSSGIKSTIIADGSGLGKRIQVIAMMKSLHDMEVATPYLVITKPSELLEWQRQLKLFAGGLRVLTYRPGHLGYHLDWETRWPGL